jgi:hypothetical protein
MELNVWRDHYELGTAVLVLRGHPIYSQHLVYP